MQVDRHPSPLTFSEKGNYPARPPFPSPPPPWYSSNSSPKYHTSTYSPSPREVAGHRSPRIVPDQNNYPSSRPIPLSPPPRPPPPPPSHTKNEFYSLTPPPSPPLSSFERNANYSSPPPPSFSEKRNDDSSRPTPRSFSEEKYDSPPPPSPPPSNDSSSGTNDSSNEIAFASLAFTILGTVANVVGVRFAARQDETTTTSLRLATALAIRDLIATHGVEGTREIISSGLRDAQLSQQFITDLLTTGRKILERKTKTGATSLADNFASSVHSLRYRLPSLSLYGRGTPSPTPNPSPSTPAEGPNASGQPNEEEQSMHGQLEAEPSVPWTSDGTLPNFESVFTIGTVTSVSEVDLDEPRESTTVQIDSTETSNDEPERITIIQTHEPEESAITQTDATEASSGAPEENTTVQMDDTETTNDGPEQSTIAWSDDTEIYTPELEESELVWKNEQAKVLESFDPFSIFYSKEVF
ncbi:hypothetical protein L207DRAFT_517136 [Hyaloscypha variabilis F]|uniref:Uncharacterized protein n=1 Tax=Hyaloscypha variabilis (strain UAMH 11265 / GT02V1 / F) TaxID=1149755 RepID=A0A2J6R927_HYAVF|nr:hypothetical protein L207DRAFT_517136 [Hyaloscypha variabilis F]